MQSKVSRTTDANGIVDNEGADEGELDVDDLGMASESGEMGMWRAIRSKSSRVCTKKGSVRYLENKAD